MTTDERNNHFFAVVNPQLERLARLICEASAMDDQVLDEARYQDLCAYYLKSSPKIRPVVKL